MVGSIVLCVPSTPAHHDPVIGSRKGHVIEIDRERTRLLVRNLLVARREHREQRLIIERDDGAVLAPDRYSDQIIERTLNDQPRDVPSSAGSTTRDVSASSRL